MSDNKKYYYLKVKDTFFDSEEMKILESMDNGLVYQNVYLKMCLLSLKSEGALMFKDLMPYDVRMLSTVLRINVDTIKTAVEIFVRMGLVTITDNEQMYMTDIQSLIGKSSTEGDRVKKYREKLKGVQMYENRTPEIEKEIELKKEIDTPKKHRYADNITLTEKEYNTLCETFSKSTADFSIKFLSDYKKEKGYKTKSDYLTIRRWVIDAVSKNKTRTNTLCDRAEQTDFTGGKVNEDGSLGF